MPGDESARRVLHTHLPQRKADDFSRLAVRAAVRLHGGHRRAAHQPHAARPDVKAARHRAEAERLRAERAAERAVLLFDVWHPDFSDEEVKFLSYLQKSQMKEEVSCQSLSKCARLRQHVCMRQHDLAQHRTSAAARHHALMHASMRQRLRLPR